MDIKGKDGWLEWKPVKLIDNWNDNIFKKRKYL